MTWLASALATTTAGARTVRMLVYAKRANVTKRQENAHVILASGVPSATTIAIAASTPSVMQWRAGVCAIPVGPEGTAGSSATATTRHATSSQDAASVGKDCGAHDVNGTASVLTASATQPTGHARARRGTVGSSAGSRALLGIMDKTAGTGEVLKKDSFPYKPRYVENDTSDTADGKT